jgi:hypothetical protein
MQVKILKFSLCILIALITMYEVLLESSWTRSEKKCWLNLILDAISIKIVSLGMYTAIPSFLPCFKSIVEVILLNAVEYRLRFPLDVRHCFEMLSLQFHFKFGKKAKSQRAMSGE